jgi:hypothetical protein
MKFKATERVEKILSVALPDIAGITREYSATFIDSAVLTHRG